MIGEKRRDREHEGKIMKMETSGEQSTNFVFLID